MSNSNSFFDVYVQALEELALPAAAVRTPGYRHMDSVLGGFRPHEYTILCGSTGSGKSQWLSCLSAELLKQAVPHFVMNVENGATDFIRRVMSALVGQDLNTGDPVAIDALKAFDDRYGKYLRARDSRLGSYDNRVSLDILKDELIHHAEVYKAKLAIVDNINFFLEPTTAANALIEMDRVTHELVVLCKFLDMHVIMVQHPKKTENGRVESEFDIKGSSTAVQEAHNVLLFNRPSQEQREMGWLPTDRELKFAKLRRRGGYTGHRIKLGCENSVRYHEKELYEL